MKKWISVFVLFLLFGCATLAPRVTAPPQVKDSKVAIAVIFENKSISYYEEVYKVLYIEKRKQEASFDGLWDIDSELTDIFSKELLKINLDAHSIKSILKEPDDYEIFEQSVLETRVSNFQLKDLELKNSTVEILKNEGFSYIILLRINCFSISGINSFIKNATIEMPTHFVIFDMNSLREVYREAMFMRGYLKYENSPRDIELNNFEILRKFSKEQLNNAAINRVPIHLGMEMAEGTN